MNNTPTAKELFRDWVDIDEGFYYVGCLLGIMEYDADHRIHWQKYRGVWETRNKLGNTLWYVLEHMVVADVLEKNEEDQFRWNASFRGVWDGGSAGRTSTDTKLPDWFPLKERTNND